MSFFSTTSCLQYCIRGTRNTTGDQVLKLRFGHCSRLISGFPHQILQQTPSTLIGEALFPLCLSDLEEAPFLAHFCVVEFLSSFNVHTSVADILLQKIASFAERLGGGVSIEARIDYVKMFWMEGQSIGEEGIVVVEETRRGAPESAIERLTNQEYEFEDEDEMEDCSVCYDEMKKGNGKEMAKMPCGHVYHKSCILTWLRTNNSCPLCRAKLQ